MCEVSPEGQSGRDPMPARPDGGRVLAVGGDPADVLFSRHGDGETEVGMHCSLLSVDSTECRMS
jgi:hypothetical protein